MGCGTSRDLEADVYNQGDRPYNAVISYRKTSEQRAAEQEQQSLQTQRGKRDNEKSESTSESVENEDTEDSFAKEENELDGGYDGSRTGSIETAKTDEETTSFAKNEGEGLDTGEERGTESRGSSCVENVTSVSCQEETIASPSMKAAARVLLSGPTWRELLVKVSTEDLWHKTRREDRAKWKEYLKEAESTACLPRKKLPEDVVQSIMHGDLGEVDVTKIPGTRAKIVIFISSTFTDTMAERNTLMRDVYPYLRTVSRILGLDFGSVDMRWGVKEETTYEHGTLEMCLREVDKCQRESAGPAVLAILGQKYGYRQFPPEIEQLEYEKMTRFLEDSGADIDVLRRNFALDTNEIPPSYILKPRPKKKEEQAQWWNDYTEMQQLLRKAADSCLPEDKAQLYRISVTENELKQGVFDNDNRDSQVTIVDRSLYRLEEPHHCDRKIIDVVSSEEGSSTVDAKAQALLKELKNVKLVESVARDSVLKFVYEDNTEEACREYVRQTCDEVCEKLVTSILQNYKDNLHVEADGTFFEILQHRAHAVEKCSLFVGREDLLGKITDYVSSEASRPFVVHGQSGCGKTALMAMAAKKSKDLYPSGVLISRFLGTTGKSGSARAVLQSICLQITRAYDKDPSQVPVSYKELIPHFQQCLGYSSPDKPLLVFLDSLDQLSNEDFGRNLKWLPLKENLPANTYFVVSTLPVECLDILDSFFPQECFLEVLPMKTKDGPEVLNKMLSALGRTLTEDQRSIVLSAFNASPLPLYLRLAVDVATKWRSFDEVKPDQLASDMQGLVSTLFQRLESRYGVLLVHHALAYLTAAKNGLSSAELEDILSCDDEVLEEVFEYWLPPFRRIPQLLWIRIRNELGMYLVERGADGVNTYGWYHRQFWETATERYLDRSPDGEAPFQAAARNALVDYFEGKYYHGKTYEPKKISSRFAKEVTARIEDRQVPRQPSILAGDRQNGRKLNRRKLAELPYNLIRMGDWSRFVTSVASLEFIEAKFEAEMGYECMNEFIEASKNTDNKAITSLSKFIGAGLSHVVREPAAVYQLASQQIHGTHVRELFEAIPKETLPFIVVKDLNPPEIEDPCEMTLQGHTSGVRCCQYSPNGEMVASTGEDGSLRLWDAYSGAEVVTVTGLPGPLYPSLADPYHGERPCCFSSDGKYIVTGSEDGYVQTWDLTGAQIHSQQAHTDIITSVAYSPDGTLLASVAKDGVLKLFSEPSEAGSSIALPGPGMGCTFSPDGSFIAVALNHATGMVLVDTNTKAIRASGAGNIDFNICVGCSPDGRQLATGGSDSSITLWESSECQTTGLLCGHRGWVWCVRYSPDGSKLLSCSSDRSLKMWDPANQSCLISLGGHLHRLTWVDFKPGHGNKFVTASLDSSLKVWDYEAVAAGKVPPVGGMHYITLSVSPDQKYLASSQGWSSQCGVVDAQTGQSIGSSASHPGFIQSAIFSPDCQKLVSVDTGHGGAYEKGAAYNAVVNITAIPSCSHVGILGEAKGPVSLACSNKYIVVGTVDTTIDAFDMSTFEHVHSWSWLDEGTTVDSEIEDKSVRDLACSLIQDHVAACAGSVVKVYDVSNIPGATQLLKELDSHSCHLTKTTYSANGKYLATGDIGGTFRIWDVGQGYELLKSLTGHVSMCRDMAFSPASTNFVTVATEMSMRVWDVTKDFQMTAAYFSPINYCAFTAENRVVVGEATGNKRYLEWKQ